MAALTRLTKGAASLSPVDCLKQAKDHLQRAASLAASKPTVNMALAKAIIEACEQVVADFDSLPPHSKAWLKGAMLYFAQTEDGEHDFDSFLGFDDDCEVLNACLELAGRDDLLLNPEDYD